MKTHTHTDPLTVVKDTPPNDTADNEQTQKNGSDQNDRKKENPSDQNDRKKENGIDQYGSWDTNEDSLGKWMFPIRIVTTRSEGYDSRQQHWRTEQRRNGGSTVWRMFKTLVVLVLVVGSVYVCIRYKKKVGVCVCVCDKLCVWYKTFFLSECYRFVTMQHLFLAISDDIIMQHLKHGERNAMLSSLF